MMCFHAFLDYAWRAKRIPEIPPFPKLSDYKIDYLARQPGQFLFENPRARKDGKRYTLESLNRLWRQACKETGESIDMYSGLKHSSCSQFVNEMGGALSDLQVLTDHARLDSVRRYAETQIARKRELMDSSGKNLAGLLKVVK